MLRARHTKRIGNESPGVNEKDVRAPGERLTPKQMCDRDGTGDETNCTAHAHEPATGEVSDEPGFVTAIAQLARYHEAWHEH